MRVPRSGMAQLTLYPGAYLSLGAHGAWPSWCGRTRVQQQEMLTGHLPKEMEEEREGRIRKSK